MIGQPTSVAPCLTRGLAFALTHADIAKPRIKCEATKWGFGL
jgi:hypothetical protein